MDFEYGVCLLEKLCMVWPRGEVRRSRARKERESEMEGVVESEWNLKPMEHEAGN